MNKVCDCYYNYDCNISKLNVNEKMQLKEKK